MTPQGAVPFPIPALPPLSAVRDRHEEAVMRALRQRDDGWVAGYDDGLAVSKADVEREIEGHRRAAQRLFAVAAAVEEAARELAVRDAVTLRELEREAVALAVALAAEIVGRELRATETPVLDAVQRAIGLLPDRGLPTLRVHPDDEATVREAITQDVLTWPAGSTVVGDRSIEPGGCVVDVGACRIDAQIGTALDRMRAALDS